MAGFLANYFGVAQPEKEEKKKSDVKLLDISMEEVRKHNKDDDCWVVIRGKVYDISNFVEDHPGGDIILDGAGKDATDLFYDIGHGQGAIDMLDEFVIGKLLK